MSSNKRFYLKLNDMIKFKEILIKLNLKGMQFVVKNTLKYLIDDNENCNKFLNYENSCSIYKLFLLLVGSEFNSEGLESV